MNEELRRQYDNIITTLTPLLGHENDAVRMQARMQIDRCRRSLHELHLSPF